MQEAGDRAEAPQAITIPRWTCHKEVNASKIIAIEQAPANQERMHAGGDWVLSLECGLAVYVGHDEYFNKHRPAVGGYYVRYTDGYQSYSPAKAFEEGYAAKNEGDATDGAIGWGGGCMSFALGNTEVRLRAICYFNGEDPFRAPHLMAIAGDVPDQSLRMITFCVLVLENGFTVVGLAYCHEPANFDETAGKKAAYDDAVDQLFELLAFQAKADAHCKNLEG